MGSLPAEPPGKPYQGYVYLIHLSYQGQYPHDGRSKDLDPNGSFYVFVGICDAVNGHNCIPMILQWGVSLLVHYYQALLDVMLTLISEVQILTFFLQMLGLPCVLFG